MEALHEAVFAMDCRGRCKGSCLFDEQLDVRDLLRNQGRAGWIIISTGMFTSFLFELGFGVVALAQNTVRVGKLGQRCDGHDFRDIGASTVVILFAEPMISNQVVYAVGDTITSGWLANTVDAVLGKKVQRIKWSAPGLEAELAHDPENVIKKHRVVFAMGKGVTPRTKSTKPTATADQPTCDQCHVLVDAKVVNYCRAHEERFGGGVLCRTCRIAAGGRTAVPVVTAEVAGPSCQECSAPVDAKGIAFAGSTAGW